MTSKSVGKARSVSFRTEIGVILADCKVADLNPSYWGRRILRAAGKPSCDFTQVDKDNAANWTVCACGQLSPNIERDKEIHAPLDETLALYGEDFYRTVRDDDVIESAYKLVAIEERANDYLIEQAKS